MASDCSKSVSSSCASSLSQQIFNLLSTSRSTMHPMSEYTPYAQQPHAVSAPPSPPLATWTAEQIVYWMRQSFFDETSCQAFQRQAVDGARLVRLTMLDLQPPLFFGDSNAANRLLSLIAQANSPIVRYGATTQSQYPVSSPPMGFAPSHHQPQHQPNYQPQYQPDHYQNHPHQTYQTNVPVGFVVHQHNQEPQAPQSVYEINQDGMIQIDQSSGRFTPNRKSCRTMIFPIVWIIMILVAVLSFSRGPFGNLSFSFAIPALIFFAISVVIFYRFINVSGYEFSTHGVRLLPFHGPPQDIPLTDLQDVYIRHHVRKTRRNTTHGYMIGFTLRPGILVSRSNKLEVQMLHTSLGPARNIAVVLSRMLGLPLQEAL